MLKLRSLNDILEEIEQKVKSNVKSGLAKPYHEITAEDIYEWENSAAGIYTGKEYR